ncbi:MAG: bifunctional diaminohydroxyphosphoribosylaminopyrimidine deaminase/5-amino-6-(5-phosphoribosylamino)uracil reductase RibD [Kiritimatiellia bacterium]
MGESSESGLEFMRRAWRLAAKSCGHTRPNPPVGAVVVKGGRIVGEGRHRVCGGDHAEAAALKACRRVSPKGATVYCTLEPCSKPGRVGACCDALIAAGVGRVEWACPDPNPKNRGKAARVLRRAGIETACWAQSRVAARREMARAIWAETLRPFAKHVTTGLPYVTVKLAMSLDGRICDDEGRARWISGRESLRETATWRERADVVMVGAGTVRADNPSLLCHTRRNDDLWRAVVSASGRLPKTAQVFTDDAKGRTLVYRDAVEAVRDLGRRGFMSVLCEGGLGLARALAAADLVDEWVTILCPIVIGGRPLAEARRFLRMAPVGRGTDVFVTGVRREAICSRD